MPAITPTRHWIRVAAAGVASVLAACGGGGGGSASPAPAPPAPAPSAPSLTFTGDRSSLQSGDSVNLTWQSTDAQSCSASSAWAGAKSASGSETVGPLTTGGSFVLSCSGAGGTTQATFAFTVAPAPPPGPTAPPPFPDPLTPGSIAATGRTFGLGAGNDVQDIESDPARHRVYLSFRNSIVVLSSDTYLVERVVPIGSTPRGIALSRDGSRLYVALANGGSVAILDTQTFQKTTVEVVVEVGTPFVWDVLEVQPGIVLVAGHCFYQSNCNAYLVTVDTNNGNARKRVAGGRRVWNGPTLKLSHDRRYVYLDGGTQDGQQALRLDNTSPNLPVDLEGAFVGQHFELNTSDTMIITGGGVVMNAADFSRLLSGSVGGPLGYDNASNEIALVLGQALYLLDAETLLLKKRFMTNCPIKSLEAVQAAQVRGEWVLAYAGNEICIVSTTAPTLLPGADGSRQLPPYPTQQYLPTDETFVGRAPSAMAADFGRNLLYVSSTQAGGILAIDANIGGVVKSLNIAGQLGEVAVSADGSRLLVARIDNGTIVVVNLASWSIERTIDLRSLLGSWVERLIEIEPNRWLAKGRYEFYDAPSPAQWVRFDPSGVLPAAKIGDPRGYCDGTGYVSKDRRYLYLSAPGCEPKIEKRDLTASGWPVVAASDPTHGLFIWLMSESDDGTRLYLNGRVLNPTTLTQKGAFPAEGMVYEVPSSNMAVMVSGAAVVIYDRNTFDALALGLGDCISYEASFSWDDPTLWPDFSRAAILGFGAFSVDGGTCVMDIASLLLP